MPSGWTTPTELLKQLERLWERGVLLAPAGSGERFPLRLRLRSPTSRELGERFSDVQTWIQNLEEGSRRHGYLVEYKEIAHRQLGSNRVPSGVFVSSEADALRILGRTRAAERFRTLSEVLSTEFPELDDWLSRKPLALLELAESFPRILAVLRWFRENPRPGLYRRQLEIPGVDTKFIEDHRRLLGELLPLVLAPEHVHDEAGASFDLRFGMKEKPRLVRFRLLDESQFLHGLSDLTVRLDELARLELPVDDVIVTENEVNGLALPPRPRTLVLFGQGYANERLAEVPWLGSRRLLYWGDIDTHGLAILDRFRAHFPEAESLLMDQETFHEHRSMWVHEPSQQLGPLPRLTPAEAMLFDELVRGVHGENLRLEQERIGFAWVRRYLSSSS